MPFQLNRVPYVVKTALGNNMWPVLQSQVADQVVVTYDSAADYQATFLSGFTGSVNVTGVGFFPVLASEVPSYELWRVLSVSAYTNAAVGLGTLQMACYIQTPAPTATGNVLELGPAGPRQAIATAFAEASFSPPAPRYCPPGSRFGVFAFDWTTVAQTINVHVVYQRFPA